MKPGDKLFWLLLQFGCFSLCGAVEGERCSKLLSVGIFVMFFFKFIFIFWQAGVGNGHSVGDMSEKFITRVCKWRTRGGLCLCVCLFWGHACVRLCVCLWADAAKHKRLRCGCVEKQLAGSESSLGTNFCVQAQPVEALPSVTHQFCHAAGVENQRSHNFVQLCEEVWKRGRKKASERLVNKMTEDW